VVTELNVVSSSVPWRHRRKPHWSASNTHSLCSSADRGLARQRSVPTTHRRGQHGEAFGRRVTLDNLQIQSAVLFRPVHQLAAIKHRRPRVSSSAETAPGSSPAAAWPRPDPGGRPPLPAPSAPSRACRPADGAAAFHLLAAVIASYAPFSTVFTDWLSRIAALGVASRPWLWRSLRAKTRFQRSQVPPSRHVLK